MKEQQQPEFMTVQDVARKLRVSINLVYSWLNENKIHGYKLPGGPHGIWRITPAALNQFLEENQA